jgi:hypothetical protein
LLHIHPPTPFLHILPLSLLPTLQIGPLLQFCRRKIKWHSCFFKIGSFPCDVSMYIHIIPWISSSPLFFSYLSPLLMVVSTGLKILYLFLYRKYINCIYLLNFLLLPFSFNYHTSLCRRYWCHLYFSTVNTEEKTG